MNTGAKTAGFALTGFRQKAQVSRMNRIAASFRRVDWFTYAIPFALGAMAMHQAGGR